MHLDVTKRTSKNMLTNILYWKKKEHFSICLQVKVIYRLSVPLWDQLKKLEYYLVCHLSSL